ncbi:MAG: hypothetical protein M0Z82_02725 [Actinomycetota bacterium]|nr:hypothetical protein [Actinomycetota bacterium]
MTRESMQAWVLDLDPTSTTDLEKRTPRLARGDRGGCPVLVANICRRTI